MIGLFLCILLVFLSSSTSGFYEVSEVWGGGGGGIPTVMRPIKLTEVLSIEVHSDIHNVCYKVAVENVANISYTIIDKVTG